MDDFLILLQAKLDEAKSKGNINADIDKLQGQLDRLKIQATLDPKSAQNLANEIGKLVNQKIVISNIGIDTGGLNKSGQKAADDFSNSISQGLKKSSNILNSFKKSLENMGMGSKEIDSVAEKINNLGVQIESLNQSRTSGKKDTLSVNIAGIDQYGQAIKLTQQYDIATGELIQNIDNISTVQQKAGSATEAFIEKQKKAIASAQNTLSTIETKLSDPNITKSLADTDFDSNGLNTQLDRVRTSISALETASRDTFTQAQIDVDKEITSLNNLITTLKNAEYAATSLRTKDINTVKIDEGNNLNTFVQKMEQSGHYTDELKQKIENLRTQLNGVFDANTLTSYLNSLSNLESEFKSVDATAKTLEKTTKIQTNIEAEKKILQVYTNELKEAGVLTDDVKEKIQNMFYSLSKVDSQNGLTTWRAELKGVKAETDAVLKSVTQEKSEEEKLTNALATVREKTEQARKTEEQRQQLAQNNAINKALEQEYQERLKIAEATEVQINKIQLLSNGGIKNDYATQLAVLEGRFSKLGLKEDEVTSKTSKVTTAFNNLKARLAQPFDESNFQEIINLNNNLQKELIESQNELTRLSATMKLATDSSRLNQVGSMQKWADSNGKAMKKWGNEINDIISQMGNLEVVMSKSDFDSLIRQFKRIQNEARTTGNIGMTTVEKFQNAWNKIGGWSLVTGAFAKIGQTFRQMYGAIVDVDTAMTNLYKVTDETEQRYNKFLESSSKSAKELGRSISSLVEQTANWAKLGFSLDEAEKLAKISSIYANVGEVDNDTAVSDMVTAMKAFDVKSSEAITIVDKLNKLGNEYATSAAALGDGLSRSASAMATSGTNLNKTLAMLTGGTEITQNASEFGNFLKVGSMRIRGKLLSCLHIRKVYMQCYAI